MADFSIKAHDQQPSIQASLTSSDLPIDLTNAVDVYFIMRLVGSQTVKVNAPASIVIPMESGFVRYDWAVGDTDTPGQYQAEWEIHWPGVLGSQTVPTLTYHTIDILADLDGAA